MSTNVETQALPVTSVGGAFPILPPVNRWDSAQASGLSPLQLLAYRSNLLGSDRSVANWGGGNTSCKSTEVDFRGRQPRVLWVKGSGSDLGTIRPEQFTGLRLDDVMPLLERDVMSDEELIVYYEHAVLKPGQPRASIETPLHSMLPFDQVDHTHPDAIIALCAVPEGPGMAQRLWGGRAIWVDFEAPGFSLGKKIALAVRERPDAACVLMAKHGLVTWADTAEACYARTIDSIGRAAEALAERADRRRVFAVGADVPRVDREVLIAALPALRGAVSQRQPMVLRMDTSDRARAFASRPDLAQLASAGPACPDHLVHTKPWPQVVPLEAARAGAEELVRAFREGVAAFEERYATYFRQHAGEGVSMRDPAPRVVLVPEAGVVTTGPDAFQASVAAALYERAIAVLSTTAGLDGFAPLTPSETFDVEYWPMELYKLGLLPPPKVLRRQDRGGSIVFVASKNGLVGGRNAAAYSSAKALEIHLARCLAEEGGGAGIRLNTVNPDAVLQGSSIWNSAWREERARTYGIPPEQLEEHYRARTTLKVNVFPEDIAEAVLFFASPRSAKSTGNILNVDGGVVASYTR